MTRKQPKKESVLPSLPTERAIGLLRRQLEMDRNSESNATMMPSILSKDFSGEL